MYPHANLRTSALVGGPLNAVCDPRVVGYGPLKAVSAFLGFHHILPACPELHVLLRCRRRYFPWIDPLSVLLLAEL